MFISLVDRNLTVGMQKVPGQNRCARYDPSAQPKLWESVNSSTECLLNNHPVVVIPIGKSLEWGALMTPHQRTLSGLFGQHDVLAEARDRGCKYVMVDGQTRFIFNRLKHDQWFVPNRVISASLLHCASMTIEDCKRAMRAIDDQRSVHVSDNALATWLCESETERELENFINDSLGEQKNVRRFIGPAKALYKALVKVRAKSGKEVSLWNAAMIPLLTSCELVVGSLEMAGITFLSFEWICEPEERVVNVFNTFFAQLAQLQKSKDIALDGLFSSHYRALVVAVLYTVLEEYACASCDSSSKRASARERFSRFFELKNG